MQIMHTTTLCPCLLPSSRANIAEILKAEGYIADYTVEDARVGKTLTLELKYSPTRERAIAGTQ